jgi:hypothetical protein
MAKYHLARAREVEVMIEAFQQAKEDWEKVRYAAGYLHVQLRSTLSHRLIINIPS